jgi:secreted Zn-dependent insulinase-like peptidase
MIIHGYNCKQFVLARALLEKISAFECDEERFNIIREEVREYFIDLS